MPSGACRHPRHRAEQGDPHGAFQCGVAFAEVAQEADERGYNYVARFPDELEFENTSKKKKSVWFNVNSEAEAGEDAATWLDEGYSTG